LHLHFKTTLPNERQLVKTGTSRRNYTTIYVGLTPDLVKKLGNMAKSMNTTESAASRKILDAYFQNIEKRGLPYESLRKFSPVGLKVLPRTITKKQGLKLRELVEKTGRKMSELVREAVESFIEQR
jgi:predicted DNA-binding protein